MHLKASGSPAGLADWEHSVQPALDLILARSAARTAAARAEASYEARARLLDRTRGLSGRPIPLKFIRAHRY